LALGSESVIDIDWERIKFLVFDGARTTPSVRAFDMSDPLFWSKQNTQQVFDNATSLEEALDKLDSLRGDFQPPHPWETSYGYSTYQ
jgi:hypothetical protein